MPRAETPDPTRHNAFFIGTNVREAVRDGKADYTPTFLSEIPHLLRSGQRAVDVALITVSPPDVVEYSFEGQRRRSLIPSAPPRPTPPQSRFRPGSRRPHER